jgi:rhomboid family GlyGly-CTERM serine protease
LRLSISAVPEPALPLTPNPARIRPWITIIVVAAAVLATVWPAAGEAMIYDRGALLRGEVWRLWAGHVVHLGWAHLGWNLAVVIPAGLWLERIAPRPARWFLAIAPGVIAAGLLVFLPDLARFAGLSALATGLVVLLALDRLRAGGREPRWIWLTVLGLVGVKLLGETLTGGSLFASLSGGARVVPLAHLLGCVAALGVWLAIGRTHRRPDGA